MLMQCTINKLSFLLLTTNMNFEEGLCPVLIVVVIINKTHKLIFYLFIHGFGYLIINLLFKVSPTKVQLWLLW